MQHRNFRQVIRIGKIKQFQSRFIKIFKVLKLYVLFEFKREKKRTLLPYLSFVDAK